MELVGVLLAIGTIYIHCGSSLSQAITSKVLKIYLSAELFIHSILYDYANYFHKTFL